jgi:peptidoglycan/LPS O-acetylase OafA/YrhL
MIENKGDRIFFLDHLRTLMIFFVIMYHSGGVYESSGFWAFFWLVDDPVTNDLVGIFNIIIDIFVMATIFFVSGFFAPLSLKKKSSGQFLLSKTKRLILPWLVASFTLIPLYKFIFLYSRNLPQEHWTTYFSFSNGIFSLNWLWFLPVLFLFNLLYVLLAKLNIRMPNLSFKNAAISVLMIGFLYSFSFDYFGLRGWTKSPFIDFQNERLLIYFMFFMLGALAFERKIFEQPVNKKMYNIISVANWLPITTYIIFLLIPFISPGTYLVSPIFHKAVIWLNMHLSLFCLVYILVETYRRYFDKPGALIKELNLNSYSVYIIHVIVLGGIGILLLDAPLPSLAKYIVLTFSTFIVSNALVSAYRRIVRSKQTTA